MRRALWRQPVDRLPVQTNFTGAMGRKLRDALGVDASELSRRLDNHLLRVDVGHTTRFSDDGRVGFDWWGAGWDTQTEGYWNAASPLAASRDLDRFAWPDPDAPGLLDEAAAAISADGGEHFVAPNFGICLFERAWSLRGFTAFLMDLVDDPEWAAELLDRITDIRVRLASRFVDLGIDGGYLGDDYGAQRGMLFSPKLWRQHFKPRLARIVVGFRRHGPDPGSVTPHAVGYPGRVRAGDARSLSERRAMMSSSDRRAAVLTAFEERYHARPTVWARAPGRVDLMGSHTDYNLGHVLTLPIGLDAWIAAMPRDDHNVRLYSLNLHDEVLFGLDRIEPGPMRHWSDYPRGVARMLQDEGHELAGFDGVLHGTVPIGSGLSSSAALECVTATVFEALGGWRLDPVEKAKLCQRAENRFVGVNCGILDQFTSCLGREGCALLLDCRDLISRPVQIAPGIRVVICDTRAKRELAGSEYGERRAECEQGAALLGVTALRDVTPEAFSRSEISLSGQVARRCRFIIEENERVLRLAEALTAGDRPAIASLCASSFEGASRLYEIGAPAMDSMMAAMRAAPGVIGARQAGAGFGGCMVAFVDARTVDRFASSVQDTYYQATGLVPEVAPVEAAAGAGLMEP